MPNIASILKAEITRLARKEVRAETQQLRKWVVAHRSEIAALKRRNQELEQALRRLRRAGGAARPPVATQDQASVDRVLFSAKSLASQRRRLGLSAHDCGLLLGTSGQAVYNWEAGKARPRQKYLPALAALRTLKRKDALAVLASRR